MPATAKVPGGRRGLRRTGVRLLGLLVLGAMACGGSGGGCGGCGGSTVATPIPGGFPTAERFSDGLQFRLSSTGLRFFEQNFATILRAALAGTEGSTALSFPIPSTCDGNQRLCCNQSCAATVRDIQVSVQPAGANILQLTIRLNVATNKMAFTYHQAVPILPDIDIACDITYDSTGEGSKTIDVEGQIVLAIDSAAGGELKIVRRALSLKHFDCSEVGDLDISGGLTCSGFDLILGFGPVCNAVLTPMQQTLQSSLEAAIDEMIAAMSLGTEGRQSLAELMSDYIPGMRGAFDYSIFAGHYARAEASGVAIGTVAGFRAPKHNPCVPDCSAPGAACSPPASGAIVASGALQSSTRPDGKPYHIGIAMDQQLLERAAYALYDAGGLCISAGPELSSQLNSGLFSLLLPSLKDLTAGASVPLKIALHPLQPPKIRIGDGTYVEDANGAVTITDPLIELSLQDFVVDMYAMVEQRYVRIFTVTGDLAVPILLFADGAGKLQPIIGDLAKGFTNVKATHTELLTEAPSRIEQIFPTLLGIAASSIAASTTPMELTAIQGFELVLDGGSIVSVDNNQALAIFANLAVVSNTSAPASALRRGGSREVRAQAKLEKLIVPPTADFSLERRATAQPPSAIIALGTGEGAGSAGAALEWSYRIDGGFFRPWTRAQRLVVRDPLFWLQGPHRIDVIARRPGQPATTSKTPLRIDFAIDTQPPRLALKREDGTVRAEVSDLAAASPQDIELAWQVGDAPFGPFGSVRALAVPADVAVRVRARDKAGQLTERFVAPYTGGSAAAEPESAGGCRLGADGGGSSPWSLGFCWTALALLVLRRKRRRNERPL